MPKRIACFCIAMLVLTQIGIADAARHHSRSAAGNIDPSVGACTIGGVVHNRRDQLVPGATIKIFRRRGGGAGHLDAQQRTGSLGSFEFHRPAGQFRVVAAHKGDGRAVVFIHTVANQVFNLELSLNHHPPCGCHTRFHLGTGRIH
jgi:hypothetical protein